MICGFCRDLELRGFTHHSIESYKSCVQDFILFYSEIPTEIKALGLYLNKLRSRNLSGSTIKGYFAALNTFYDYLIFQGAILNNPIPSFRTRYLSREKNMKETRQLISIQQMRLLISSSRNIQEKTIMMILAKTGMRRGELLGLQGIGLDLKNNIINIPPKAKRSNRIAFMDDELKYCLEDYLRILNTQDGRLFPVHKDYPAKILADLGSAAGIHQAKGPLCYRLTPHCFRHFFTTHLYRAGMDAQHIKWLRGDSLSSEAWQIYNHLDPEAIRQEYLRRIPKLISFDQKLEVFV